MGEMITIDKEVFLNKFEKRAVPELMPSTIQKIKRMLPYCLEQSTTEFLGCPNILRFASGQFIDPPIPPITPKIREGIEAQREYSLVEEVILKRVAALETAFSFIRERIFIDEDKKRQKVERKN